MRRTFLLLILIMSFLLFGTQKVTIYVDDAYKPFCFRTKNGEAKGMCVDVLKAVFKKMKDFDVNIKPVSWKRGKRMMEKGQGFGLAPAFFHGHDWDYLYPYSLPFYDETIVVICNRNILNKNRENWPDDYIGLKVGNVAGFDGWGGPEFRKLVKDGKIKYEEAKGSTENILKLAKGRVDCIMMNEAAYEYEIRKLIADKKYIRGRDAEMVKTAVVGKDASYIGYSKTAINAGKYPFHQKFRQQFDAELYKMLKAGEVKKIMSDYKD